MSKGFKATISLSEKRSLLSTAEVRLKSILLYEVFHQRCCFYIGYY